MLLPHTLLVLFSAYMGNCDELKEPERHQVVIVGAGVSGLGAAVTLLEHNITDFIILEASDRIGGRVHTVEFGGLNIDKGAEFVHGEVHNSVYDLVKPYDMLLSYDKTFCQPEKYFFTNTAGDDFNSSYVEDLLEEAYGTLVDYNSATSNASVVDYFNAKVDKLLQKNNVESKLGQAVRNIARSRHVNYNALDSLDELGSSTIFDESEDGDTSLKWRPELGYKTLFDVLLEKYPNPQEELPVLSKTLFGKQVNQVKYGDGKSVEVHCADDSSYLADHVIMTVSLGVLKKHADTMFHPALPERKTATIKAMGFGVLGKIFALFPTRWWPKDFEFLIPLLSNEEIEELKKTNVNGQWMTESLGFHPVLGHDRMVEVWLSGQSCRTMEALTEKQVIDGIVEYMDKTFGKKFNTSRPERILRSTWASNPFTLGSYSFHSVESDKLNLSNNDLAAPVLDNNNKPVLLFAGEATNTDNLYGLVNGALDTGRREANRLVEYLKNNPQ